MKPIKSSLIVRLFRLLRLIIQVLKGIGIATFILPKATSQQRDQLIQNWCQQVLDLLNVERHVFGQPPNWQTKGTMFIANHVSWMDIHALNCVRTIRFIGKSDIKSWPVFGWFAIKANTLFIEREKKQGVGLVVNTALASLKAGDCMCFFPEGTTTDGTKLVPFKGSLMQSAIDANADVWPVAIRYPTPDGKPNTQMAFADETTLIGSIWAIMSLKYPVVELHFLPVVNSAGYDRRSLTKLLEQQIAQALALEVSESSAKEV